MADPTSPVPAALELQAVVKRYGAGLTEVRALTDVSIRIAPGELVAVMGPSGCGKSTLLHLAGALEDPDAGHVLVGGRDLSSLSAGARAGLRRTDVGFVFQRLNLVPSLSALENVMLPLELEGVGAREARERARAALVSVDITEQLDRFPDDFSGGQQQRIAVARALVGQRKLILADEPTGALDTLTGDAVIELLAGLPAATGAAVVLVTHEPRYAAWADRVVFMRDGRIVDEASVATPATPATPAPVSVPAGSAVRSLRLPLRLARREVRRRPGRTALVALLVALPVAGMVLAATLFRTDSETVLQEWTRTHGQAEAAGFLDDAGRVDFPSGTRLVEVRTTYVRLKTASGERAGVQVTDAPLEDPVTVGIHDLVAGRSARQAGEVVLTASLADRFGVGVGDRLDLARPELSLTVVGEVKPVGCLSCAILLFAPDRVPSVDGIGTLSPFTLVDLPDDTTTAELLAIQEASAGARPELGVFQSLSFRDLPAFDPGDRGAEAVRWSLVLGALVLTVAGIVISAAFAVGARRQLVTLGQLSASGASPAIVRTALVLQGTVTGLVGALAGLALGGALLGLGQPVVERLLDKRIDGYDARPTELATIVALGVVAATLAALVPARTAARIPTLAALAGRRPLAPVSRRLVAWGFASALGGLALLFIAVLGSQSATSGETWALVAIIGGVAELLGACAIAPAIVARLEPLAARLRGSLRLGARSLARHRARTGAVVSAVAAAGALAVAAGGLVLGSEERDGLATAVPDDVVAVASERYDDTTGRAVVEPITSSVRSTLADVLPGARLIEVEGTAPAGLDGGWRATPTDSDVVDLALFGGERYYDRSFVASSGFLGALRVGDAIRDELADTGVVVLTDVNDPFGSGDVVVTLPDGRTVPGAAMSHRYIPAYVAAVLVSPATADDLELDRQPLLTLFESPEPLTGTQRGELEDLQFEIDTAGEGSDPAAPYTTVQWQYPDSGPSPFQLELLLTGVALVFSLFVVGVSLALAAAESKDERDILTIAGAPPSALARSAGARAWLLAVIGTGMAVPVGFLPVVVFSWASDRNDFGVPGFPIVFPTRTVLLLVLAVPLVVAAASLSASAVAQRLRPVRVSTAVFE